MRDDLERFTGKRYLNLETYRKNGEGVRTPVWFVEEDGVLYFRTFSNTGKVRRIRSQPRVMVVTCDRRGKPEGGWLAGEANVVEGSEAEQANRLLNRKFGLLKRLVDAYYTFGEPEMVVLAVRQITNPWKPTPYTLLVRKNTR